VLNLGDRRHGARLVAGGPPRPRTGHRRCFLLATACLVLLSQRVDTGLLMVAVAIAGLGSVVGPLFGGWVLAAGIGFEWNFYGFAVPALFGALLIGLIPRLRGNTETTTVDAQPAASATTKEETPA
jgi:AAHS family benzoate transporter-like MFS transporter